MGPSTAAPRARPSSYQQPLLTAPGQCKACSSALLCLQQLPPSNESLWLKTALGGGLPPFFFCSKRPGQGAAEAKAFPIPMGREGHPIKPALLGTCHCEWDHLPRKKFNPSKICSDEFIYIHSCMAAGLKVDFWTPAAASKSHVVIPSCQTSTNKSGKTKPLQKHELLSSSRDQIGGRVCVTP